MESSRPNGTQHHVRGSDSALSFQRPNQKSCFIYCPDVQEMNERRGGFSVFGRRASCHIVTWSTPYSPFQQTQAEAWRQFAENQCEDLKEDTSAALMRNKTWTPRFSRKNTEHQRAVNVDESFAKNQSLKQLNFFNFFFLDSSITRFLQWVSSPRSVCALLSFPSPTCLFNTLPLPQTCTHRVSSNLAACPWVHTVTKAGTVLPLSTDAAPWL